MRNNFMGRREFLKKTAAVSMMAGMAGAMAEAPAPVPGVYKKALQIGMLPAALPDADKFKLAKDCGFCGIEGAPLPDLDAAKRLGELAHAAGTPIHSIVYGGWDAPLSDPDPKVVEKGLAGMTNALRCAKAYGADTVLLVPVVVNDKATTAEAWERSHTHIPKLIPLAEELKITIAIEEVWNNFLLDSASEFARYVDEFKSPWVQAYFDVGNVLAYGLPQEWIRTLGKRIVKVHLKDFRKEGRKWVNLRDGDVNWPEVMKAFAEVGYNGYLTPELSGGDEAYLRDLSQRIDLIIAGK
ncbi:MAG TPA: sugar phosphate isomerase/epimerase family protein [Candidatus Hydrogenedentes bacterium]|jgi:hexulose-6-phosphate isomerase|nr:sugar phosphate isomerase/epimerase family protein [Candidatus Hydrogenedentota bacterium]